MKKCIWCLAVSMMCLACGTKNGDASEENLVNEKHVRIGELYYNLHDDGTAAVTFDSLYLNFIAPVTIPAEVEYNAKTYKVTTIGKEAFDGCFELRGVTIPKSVTRIRKGAFDGCQHLKSVIIPDGVTCIEPTTFRNCRRLTEVTIPSSVTRIETWAFECCWKLDEISIPSSVTYIEEGAFSGCPCEYSINYTPQTTEYASDGEDDILYEYSEPLPPAAPLSFNDIIKGKNWYDNFYPEYDDVNDYVQSAEDVANLCQRYGVYADNEIHLNQVLIININAVGHLMVQYMYDQERIEPEELQAKLEQFIYDYWREHLQGVDFTESNWEERVRPYFVYIVKDDAIGLNDPAYQSVARKALLSVRNVRERLAQQMYNKKFAELDREQRSPIIRAITNSIYWENRSFIPEPPREEYVLNVIEDDVETESIEIEDEWQEIEQPVMEEDEDDVVFQIVETMPEFPGGAQAMFRFLSENVRYPDIAAENGIQGKAQVQFTVNKDGSISDVQIVRSAGDPSLDNEAIRVIKSMPKWNPGMHRGKLVRVKYTIPVNFKLEE